MTIECPNISDSARLNATQAANALEVSINTLKKYATELGIMRKTRKVGGQFYEGKDIKRIWTRIA